MIDTEEVNSESPHLDQRVAFLSGVARSGTTAAVYLLNKHPEVAFGIERYKFIFLREKNPTSDLFGRDRFFAFDPNETNILPEASDQFTNQYAALQEKFDSVAVVGDKIPNLATRYREIIELFPDVRIVHMVREPTAVARSWERRAQNSEDDWSANADAANGIHRWILENKTALHFRRDFPDNILMVSYEGLFSDDPRTLNLIFKFLEVGPPTPHQHDVRRAGAERTAGKKFAELGEQPDYVDDDKWAQIEDLMPRLQRHVRPKPKS